MASYDLLLPCMQRSIARLLRITIALALPFSLAFLRPRLLLPPPPIFILANVLVLAIALSSRFPHPHSFPLLPSPPSHSRHPFSPLSIPLPHALPKQNLPPRYVLQRQTPQRQQHRPLSKALPEPAPPLHLLSSDRQWVAFSHPPSQQNTAEFRTRPAKKVGPSTPPAPQMLQLAICEELHHREQQRAVNAEAAQKERMVAAVTTVHRLARSKSDPTICASETAPTFIRRTVDMDCAIDTISMAFESLIDDDFCKRCAKFIANNHEKWRKESLERMPWG